MLPGCIAAYILGINLRVPRANHDRPSTPIVGCVKSNSNRRGEALSALSSVRPKLRGSLDKALGDVIESRRKQSDEEPFQLSAKVQRSPPLRSVDRPLGIGMGRR